MEEWIIDGCEDLAEPIGDITGAVYGTGASVATGNASFGAGVGTIIEDFVTDGWSDVCALPDNLSFGVSSPEPDNSGFNF